jgi:hypothetical protein
VGVSFSSTRAPSALPQTLPTVPQQHALCTQETGETTAEGTPMTVCHFLLTGRCEDPISFTVDGLFYSEVIFVYLKPTKP